MLISMVSTVPPQVSRQEYSEHSTITHGYGWDLYVASRCVAKRCYDMSLRDWRTVSYTETPFVKSLYDMYSSRATRGIAHAKNMFGEGAERAVFQCSEVVSLDGGRTAYCVGPRLVAKQARYTQHVKKSAEFHRTFCRTQGEPGAEVAHSRVHRHASSGPLVAVALWQGSPSPNWDPSFAHQAQK